MTYTLPPGTPDGLRRFLTPRERPEESCEMCGNSFNDRHPHVVDLSTRALMCCCLSCGLLFTTPGAAQGRYRTVPDRRRRVEDLVLTDAQWDALAVPVGLAFLFHNSALGHVVAMYPSPAGATESQLAMDAWDEVVAGNPVLADVEPDVEAVLLRRHDGDDQPAFSCYLVPIDACYTLVGLVRTHWRGFDGGTEARRAIDAFFDDLDARARVVEAGR
ncbi:MAG: DUF5947 family protein [Actinomycetes bacterium]